ncbi:MAG TPA: hypothetical protein VEU97_16470 [Ktedonobacteraceae bacterium]|nr:hypothetical protein [Ktedonobacteraceae bacterium]
MQCRTCATEIPNGARECPGCGAPVTTTATAFETHTYELESEAIPYVPYNSQLAASKASLTAEAKFVQTSSELQPADPLKLQRMPLQKEFTQSTPLLTRAGVFLLILLTLLIVGSGGGILVYATAIRSAELQANATAVAQGIVMGERQATATVDAQSPQHTYNLITSKSPTLSDPLNGQTISVWSVKSTGTKSCSFSNGAYHLRLAPEDIYLNCPAPGPSYNNFIYQVQLTIINGFDGGISFRSYDETTPSFSFTITTTGYYALSADLDNRLLAFGRSAAIHTGLNQANLIAVMAQGEQVSLFINKQFVTSPADVGDGSGQLGMTADNMASTNIDVAYSNAQVWSLP